MIKNILFDLDGTLLPMDMDEFTGGYFKHLARKAAPYGYDDPEKLIAGVWKGTKAMVMNDGTRSNEEAFWEDFAVTFGEEHLADKQVFDDFYANEFNEAKNYCGYAPQAGGFIKRLKAAGVRVILATNPLFPMAGQINRIRWAGIDPEDFDYISSYENSTYCKPNPMYYTELADKLGLKPEECIMIGNDAHEDTAAEKTGMHVYLLTDCLLNRDGRDISGWPHGSFDEMTDYVLKAIRR